MKTIIMTFVLVIGNVAMAGNTTDQPDASKVMISITADIDKDGHADVAMLTEADNGDLDLWIKVSSEENYYKVSKAAFNMTLGMFGQGNELRLNSAGSIQIFSYNDAIGRTRWEETITYAYRKSQVVLAGYTHFQRDTLDHSYRTCDLNLLSRKGAVNGSDVNETFEILVADVFSLDEASVYNLYETYIIDYCDPVESNEP